MKTNKVHIHVGKGYDMHIGTGLLRESGGLLRGIMSPCKAAIITDTNIEKLYLDTVKKSVSQAGFEAVSLAFPAGESSKNMRTLTQILEFLADMKITRTDVVIALGGGVVGDISGFAAGVFCRGIRYIQVPTSLLAAIDSSVGGKTAVDLSAGKNLAGLFVQPEMVICDTDVLKTLPSEFIADGMAEAIKYGIMADSDLFDELCGGITKQNIAEVIEKCVIIKEKYVREDEYDWGERRLLNLGHTIGHAIEKLSDYTVSHGNAVATGMAMIAKSGEGLALTDHGTSERINTALKTCALPIKTDFSVDEIYAACLTDKKRAGEEITLVFPERIGKCLIKTIPVSELRHIISLGMDE